MLQGLLQKEWFRYLLVLFVGVTVGAIFYPTKHIEEKVSLKYEQEISKIKEEHLQEKTKIQEDYQERVKTVSSRLEESEKKVSQLNIQVRDLKSKQKTAYYKIVRPDGTIEIKKFTESEVSESTTVITQIQEEFKTKIAQIETKWSDIHKQRVTELQRQFDSKESEYKKTIEELQKSKVVTVNEKRFGLEVGLMSNKNYYGHASMDLWGPVFVGLQGEVGENNDNKLGIGLGLRF